MIQIAIQIGIVQREHGGVEPLYIIDQDTLIEQSHTLIKQSKVTLHCFVVLELATDNLFNLGFM